MLEEALKIVVPGRASKSTSPFDFGDINRAFFFSGGKFSQVAILEGVVSYTEAHRLATVTSTYAQSSKINLSSVCLKLGT